MGQGVTHVFSNADFNASNDQFLFDPAMFCKKSLFSDVVVKKDSEFDILKKLKRG